MNVSVIIPTYNAQKYLPRLLESLKQQTMPFELLIIDSSSTDNTIEIANKYTDNIIVIPHEEFDHGGTRTKAAKASTGDILIFLTQDALPYDANVLETLLGVFNDPSTAVAYGRQLAYEKTNLFGKHLRAFNYPPHSHIRTLNDKDTYGFKTAFLSDSFAAYRRAVLQDIGWFKNGLIVGEDTHAGAKILLEGKNVAYEAAAKVYHSHSYSIWKEFKRYFDTGVFHKQEFWMIEAFGKAEGEGRRYIKSEISYLFKKKAFLLIPEFFMRNGMKYLGYKLGLHYEILPRYFVKKFSLHSLWWDKHILK